MSRPVTRWALEWRSKNRLDGVQRHFIWAGTCPQLFRTREAARKFVAEHYGYIDRRIDLKSEPHGWQLPRVVKVSVVLEERA